MMDVVGVADTLWRTFGARGLRYRASFEARRAAGLLRASPRIVRDAVRSSEVPGAWPFAPDASMVRAATAHHLVIERADRVLGGRHQAYRSEWLPLPATAKDWNRHPESGVDYGSADWFHIAHFDARVGDIKDAWEPARFAWAYDLARGWIVTDSDRYAEAFWTNLERFLEGCPPYSGVQWSCGQETAIRAMAWLWCEGALNDAPSSSGERMGALRVALAWSAERIADAIPYALSQRNNHGISEAAGLVAIGARLWDADPRARGWFERGARSLEQLVLDQIAPDGWYIQQSMTYARVALDQLVLAERALHYRGASLPAPVAERVRACVRLLADLVDDDGDTPNHGPNDGALVLPLATAGYRDFRPSITAAASTFGVALPARIERDRETLAWLGAELPRCEPVVRLPAVRAGASGWAIAHTAGARLFARAGAYRSRPGHIDALHVDIWLDGRPVAVDAGTFRYAAPQPWHNALSNATVHNTVSIPAHPMARRGPRFLWLAWPEARIASAERDGDVVRIVMHNDSWRAEGIAHRRTCELHPHGARVLDQLQVPNGSTEVVLHWLLADDADAVTVVCSEQVEISVVRGDERSVRGWRSLHYAHREPATSVEARATASPRASFASGFGSCRDADALSDWMREAHS